MSNNLTVYVGGKKVPLNQRTYLAQGGEAVVHKAHGTAYKIYHDPSKMIAEAKIMELAKVTMPNVLGPKDVVKDNNGKAIGFTMPFMANTQFLSRLFVSSFRTAENISPEMIKELVKRFQVSMMDIHAIQAPGAYLVVDNNEYNLLVSKKYDEIYFIDVDSWKTPHYPATALMDSVRDRKLKTDNQGRVTPGQFSVNSDWFSFAVTATQIYLGCHPYKGIHPNYKRRDWAKMMDDNVSIFDPQSKLPPNTQDLSVIPPAHRKWLEGVLQKGDRSQPPMPDQLVTNVTQPQVVFGTETFTIDPVRTYDGRVLGLRFIQGVCYAQTSNGLYADSIKLNNFSVPESGVKYDFCSIAYDNKPLSLTYETARKELTIKSSSGDICEVVDAENFFVANDCVYTVQAGKLVEFTATKLGNKRVLSRQMVGTVLSNNVMGDGVLSQDVFGRAYMVFSRQAGSSQSIPIKELDAYRLVETKRIKNVLVGLAEKGGRTDRFVIIFEPNNYDSYQIRIEEDTHALTINFVVLDKGIVVSQNADKAELFVAAPDGVAKYKEVDKFPLTKNQKLVSFGNNVYFPHDKKLFKIALHK